MGEYYIQLFDATLANWVGEAPGVCVLAKECGHAGVMEFNGDVYSCDHFVYPQYRLGNLRDRTITEMMYSPQQNEFARMKSRHNTLAASRLRKGQHYCKCWHIRKFFRIRHLQRFLMKN